jgi:tetratricopeptide (TPR) repeat protein
MGLMTAHTQMGITLRFVGEYNSAVEHFEESAKIYDPALQQDYAKAYRMDPGVFSFSETTRTYWAVGRIDDAFAMNERSLALGRSSPDPRTTAFTLLMAGVFYHLLREPKEALRCSADGIAIADEHQIVQERAWLTTAHGWATTQVGDIDAGVDEMAASMTMRLQMNAVLDCPYAMSQLAEGYILQGNLPKARATLLEALDIRERNDDRWFEAEIFRMLGDLTLAESNDVAEAEKHYRKSLDVSLTQGTRSFELRTCVSLARLLISTGRSTEAFELLSPVRQWFEGQRATVDSRAADEVLASLKSETVAG